MSEFRSAMEREAWAKIEGLAEFHWTDLEARGTNADTAQKFIRRWETDGRIRMIRKDGHRRLFVNVDRAIPVVPDGKGDRTPEDNMWRAMRKLPNFSPVDLASHSNAGGVEVSVEKARRYCQDLLAVGFLRVRETAIHRVRPARYQLIRNTGPRAPVIRTVRGFIDPNEEQFLPLGRIMDKVGGAS